MTKLLAISLLVVARAYRFCNALLNDRRPSKADFIGFGIALGVSFPFLLFTIVYAQRWACALVIRLFY